MQLMPATASLMGVRDPHNPDENIDAGASHLRAMLDTFKGDLPARAGRLQRGGAERDPPSRHPPFPETRQFVTRVLRRMGDKKGAETVMAKPVPPPQWVARGPRSSSKAHMVGARAVYPSAARPTMIQVAAPRAAERTAAQLVSTSWSSGRARARGRRCRRPCTRRLGRRVPDPTVRLRPVPVAVPPRSSPPARILRYDGGAPAPPRRRERSEHAIRRLLRASATPPLGGR